MKCGQIKCSETLFKGKAKVVNTYHIPTCRLLRNNLTTNFLPYLNCLFQVIWSILEKHIILGSEFVLYMYVFLKSSLNKILSQISICLIHGTSLEWNL